MNMQGKLTIFCLTICAGLITPSASVASDLEEFPVGIHYAIERNSLHPDRWRDELLHTADCMDPCTIVFDDRISAVYLRYKWMQINPKKNKYDFSDLGAVIDKIVEQGKPITLTVMAGKYTPPWVFHEGAQHIDTPTADIGQYTQRKVPLPWDDIYLQAYNTMIGELSAFLRQDSSRYNSVVMIKNSGIVIHSEEVRLMPIKAFEPTAEKKDKQAEAFRLKLCRDWAASGYTEEKILDANRVLNKNIAQQFPDKYIGMAFVEGGKRFPTVDAAGNCTYPKPNSTINKIIQQTVSDFGSKAVINDTVLTTRGGNPNILKWVLQNGGKIGFQIERAEVGCREMRRNPCDDDLVRATIQTGIDAGASYIEVHDGNIARHKDMLLEFNETMSGH